MKHEWSPYTKFQQDDSYNGTFKASLVIVELTKYWELYNTAIVIIEIHPKKDFLDFLESPNTVIPLRRSSSL